MHRVELVTDGRRADLVARGKRLSTVGKRRGRVGRWRVGADKLGYGAAETADAGAPFVPFRTVLAVPSSARVELIDGD